MSSSLAALAERLGPDTTAVLRTLAADVRSDRTRLPVVFPGLPRRVGKSPIGRDPVSQGRTALGPGAIDLGAFRSCDLAAAWLLLEVAATDAELRDLYAHGDLEERAMLLRAMHLLPIGPLTVELLGEVQRTNIALHLEAAICDGDLFARTVGQPGFDVDAANKLILKYGFLGLPLDRVFDAVRHANATLSRMLQDLATEREAAGRGVWRDTWELIGHAPTQGTVARLIGGLEHGDDGVRRAAAKGLAALGRKDLCTYVLERLPREPRADIRTLLQQIANA